MNREKIEELITKYDWYQRISLGDGLYTPAAGGDSQAKLELLQLPDGTVPWWIAIALLLIAVKPIRRLDPKGPVKVKKLLDETFCVLQGK